VSGCQRTKSKTATLHFTLRPAIVTGAHAATHQSSESLPYRALLWTFSAFEALAFIRLSARGARSVARRLFKFGAWVRPGSREAGDPL
jgi:hypothetical protein